MLYATFQWNFLRKPLMTSSDGKVLRIAIKDHLRNSSLPMDVTFVFHVFQGEVTQQRKHMVSICADLVHACHRPPRGKLQVIL